MASDVPAALQQSLRHFRYAHLPPVLRDVSKPFHDLAHSLARSVSGRELTRALDYLFDAKNWAVVAVLSGLPDADATQPASLVPRVGDVVLVAADPALNNGAEQAPAVVTRVWSATTVNVRVLYDGHAVTWHTSLNYVDTLDGLAPDALAWTWPEDM